MWQHKLTELAQETYKIANCDAETYHSTTEGALFD